MKSYPAEHLSVSLSQEELAYLVGLTDSATIPGLGEDPLKVLSPELGLLVSGVVQRSLMARSILIQDKDGLVVNDLIANILKICTHPMCVVSIATVIGDLGSVQVFSLGPKASVHHMLYRPSVHTLTILSPQPDFRAIILDLLPNFAEKTDLSPFSIKRGQLDLILDKTEPAQNLSSRGIEDEPISTIPQCNTFAEDASGRTAVVTVQVSSLFETPPVSETLMWIKGEKMVWLVSREDSEAEQLQYQIQIATVHTVDAFLSNLLSPIGQTQIGMDLED